MLDPEEEPSKSESSSSSPDVLKLVLKNVTLTVNRIHIRYEDDFYASQNPFAFGLICEVTIEYDGSRKYIRTL